ncbi:hypothetical protein ACLW9W_004699 [Escherichia coli]
MNYQAVSELITSSNHNVLIVGDSASEVDGFLNKLNITDYKYYDFSQIYSCSDRIDWPHESPDNQYHLNK